MQDNPEKRKAHEQEQADKYGVAKRLYKNLTDFGYTPDELGVKDEAEFVDKLGSPVNRKKVYDAISQAGEFDLGDYESYERSLADDYTKAFAERRPQLFDQQRKVAKAADELHNAGNRITERGDSFNPEAASLGDAPSTYAQLGFAAQRDDPSMYGQLGFTAQRGRNKEVAEAVPQYDNSELSIVQLKMQRDRLVNKLNERETAVREQYNKDREEKSPFVRWVESLNRAEQHGSFFPEDVLGQDKEANAYRAAISELNNAIKTVEDTRGNTSPGFWKGIWDGLSDGMKSFLTMSYEDINKGITAYDIASKNKGVAESDAEQEFVNAMATRSNFDNLYGRNYSSWYKYGNMTGEMFPFMLEIGLSPGSLFSAGSKGAAKIVGKQMIKEIGEQGVRKYIKANGVKGAGNVLVKNLGVVADDIGKAAITNATLGAGGVAADALGRMTGGVEQTRDGKFKIEKGKDIDEAVWQAGMSNLIEVYSEMLGGHFGGIERVIGDKLSKVFSPKWLTSVLSTGKMQSVKNLYGGVGKVFEQMGISDYFGEVGEEYAGQLLRTAFNLDDAYTVDADGKRVNLLFTKDFNKDILVGMALSMGVMGAAKGGLTAASYAKYNHDVNKADARCGEVFGQQEWQGIKNTIDNTTNEDMGALFNAIANDGTMNEREKMAAADYISKSMTLRGFNLSAARTGEEQSSELAKLNTSFSRGYNAQGTDKADIQAELQFFAERARNVLGDDFDRLDNADVATAIGIANSYSGDARTAAMDYLTAKQSYNGVEQKYKDTASFTEEMIRAKYGSIAHTADGMVHAATTIGGKRVYIISGNVVAYSDGTGVDISNSDDSIIVADEEGNRSQISPKELLLLDDVQEVEPLIDLDLSLNEQQSVMDRQSDFDGMVEPVSGVMYPFISPTTGELTEAELQPTEDGQMQHEDGSYIIKTATGEVVPFASLEELQANVNEARKAKVRAKYAELQKQDEAETSAMPLEVEVVENYNVDDEVGLEVDGVSINGVVQDYIPEDDTLIIDLDRPIDGKYTIAITTDELASMAVSHNGRELERREPQQSAKDAGGGLFAAPLSEQENGNGSNEEIAQTEQHSAVSMLPHDIDGNPIYEQGEPAVAFDAITEQCEGNGEVAMSVAESMLADKVKALKAVEKAKSKGGESVAEKIAAEKERMAAIEQAKKDVEAWQAIVEAGKIRQAAQAMGSRQAAVAPEVVADGTLNGVPDVIDDTPQEARARGYRRVNGHKVERQEPVAHSTGREVEVKFSNDKTVKGHAVLIEVDELQPSHQGGQRNPVHFIDEAQPKERVDNASRAALNRMAAHIRPEEITSSVTAYTGAPTVNARGEVIQGNNRSGALKAMYAQHKDQAEKYKQYLLDNAERLGLDRAEIEAMKNPVLVNMVDVSDEEAVNLGQYEAKDTESGGVERIKPKNTVQKIGTDIGAFFNTLFASNEEDLSLAELIDKNGAEVLAYLNRKGYITDTQYKSAFDSKGNLTAEAKNDLRGIVVSHIFQNGNSRLEEMFNAMPAKAQKAILATAYRDNASPESERMMTEIQNSVRAFHALMQYDEFANARNYEAARKAVENWAKQYQYDDATGESYLPAEKFSNFALVLAAMYKGRTQKFVQDSFTDMYDLIQGTRKGDLFGTPDNTPRTLAQAIKEVLNIDYNENRNGQAGNYGVGIDTQKSERGRRGSNGDVGGRKHSKGTEPQTDSGGRVGGDSQDNGEIVESQSFLDVVRTLYSKGKEVASKLFQRSFFDIAQTPRFMQELGLRGDKFTIKYGVIARHLSKDNSHSLSEQVWEQLPQALQNPFAISRITDRENSYRIYTTLETENGEYVVVGVDVKNAGREIEVNAISTVFGRRNNANLSKNEEVIYRSKKITPEQSSLLERPNFVQYPTGQELSDDKGTTKNEIDNEPNEKFRLRTSERQKQTERYGYTEDDYKAEDALNKKYAKELSYLDSIYDDDLEFDKKAVELDDKLPDGFTTVVRNNRCVIILHEPAVYTNLNSTRRKFKVGDTIQISYEGRYPHVTVTKVDSNGKVVSAIDAFDGRTIIENGKRRNIDDVLNEPASQIGNGDELGEKIAQAEAEVDTDPTEKQKEETVANNPATYTIEPAQYTTKRGKVLDMHLVKFADTLSKEQFRAAKELAKAERGWYDAKQGGFMMRSEESAKQLAETVVGNKEAVADAQPVSLADINKATEQQPQAGETEEDDIFSQAERIAAEVERERLAKQKKKAAEETNGKGRAEQTESVDGATPTFGRYQKAYDDFIDGIENKGMLPDIKALKNKIAQAKRRLTTLDKGAALGIKNDDDLQRHEAAMEDATQMRDAYQAMLDYVNKRVRDNEKKPKSNPSGNKLVTDERYAELRERLRKKLNNLNVGVDPEILSIGIEMAVYHLEKGSRKFADYATAMIADLGDVVRPYLKAFYNGARDLPEVESSDFATDLTPYQEVQEFDIATFGKEHNEPMTTAEVVVAEQAHQEEAEQAKQEIISQRNSERKANEGYNGFKRGDKVLFTPQGRNKKTVEATIYDFEDYGDHNPILDTGLAPILYETVEWSDIKPVENKTKSGEKQSKEKSLPLQQTGELSLSDGSIKHNEDGLQRDDAALRSERLSADSDRNAGAGGREGNLQEVREDTGRVDRRGENGNGRAGSGETQSDGVFVRPLQQLEGKNSRNNHSERGKDHAPTSVDARIEANFKAVELAKQLLESGEEATEEQKEVLRKFSGWGGLGKVFDEHANYSHDGRFYYNEPTLENKRLRELLSEEEYQQALMSANSAYYTPAYVIDTLWDIAEQMGFKGGNILEGSAGIGNILGQMPASISANSDIQAVEIDGISGAILSLLYPDAKVEIQGFEQTRVPNGSVDLAVTNVPFVTGLRVNDTTGDNDLSKKFHNIHDFCIAKNVRKLREGGLGIFITSSGTLDNSRKLRDWVVNEGEADFVGAFRMNNKTFVGTGVTSDIIVIRKRVNGRKSANAIDVSTVTGERVAEYDTGEKRKVKGQYEPVVKNLSMDYNKYFMEHPERMAGEMRFGFEEGDRYRPTSKGLYPKQGTNQKELLSEFVKSFTQEEVGERSTEEKKNDEVIPDKKVGEMFVKDGKLYINSISNARLLDVNSNKVKGHTKAECFEAYSAIKKALADVLAYQTENESDDGLKPLLDKLNKAYDDFVETYGHFNKNTAIAFLRNDVDYANVSSVETYKEQGVGKGGVNKIFGKADVMDKRVVEKVKEPNPTNVKEGIVASVFKFGHVDVPYIAERLGRSIDDVKNEIIENGYGFEDPVTRKVEASYQYLSGNVREKLSQAEANNENGEFDRNIKALQEKIPMDIPAHLIDFTLGSSWIDPELYDEYVKERTDVDARFTLVGGTWFMKEPSSTDYEKNRAMGVKSEVLNSTTMGHELIEAAIQNKTITVSTTRKNWDGTSETITDKDATQACANKIDEIRQDFKDWAKQKMQSDPDMSAKMERVYNDTFNNFVPISIPDEFAPEHFAGANPRYTMRPHQSRAIVRGTQQSVLLAHEVGTGKTFTLISTAMEMRRLGTARKPMIVVQNATVGQFVADAKELYPNAKILTLEDSNRNVEGRKNFYAKIRYNDWDMIIVPQSVFEHIPDSENRQYQYIKEKIDEKVTSILQMKEQDPYGDSLIVEQAEREVERLEEELAELSSVVVKKNTAAEEKKRAVAKQNAEVRAMEMLDRRTDDVENFDDMGIDALLVDEAHEYKHLGFATAMQRGVKGVDPSYSKKSQGVFLKAQAVMEKNNGRNVVFATGTPISNTAAEIWAFMRYLMPADTMKEYGIYYFDDFVRNFGNIQQMLEFTTSGKFKENNRFAGYVNLPELVRIWSGVSDTVLTEEAPEVMEKIPELEGGKAQDIYLPQTRALRSVMKFVKSELERFDNMSGKEKKANSHIPLTMYGIAKAAAVDARLVQADAEDDPNSKTNEAVRQTLRSLKETADYNGTVAIFADNYQNKASGFNLYEDIRAKLIAEGVPADEIVVIKSGMTVKKKAAIFDKFNHGEVRVLLGSTFTLGTGVNIQERLHTLIHLDAPNRPMDYTQRNGRILRQGNIHKEMGKPVRVLRFGVEDSLDVTAYQRLKTKGAIADSIMRGRQMMENSMVNRVLEEEEDVFGDTIAQLSGSEYAMLKNNAEKNMRKYASRKKQYEADQTYIHNAKPKLKGLIKEAEQRIEDNGSYLKAVQSAFPNGRFGEISVGKQRFASVEAMEDFFKDYNKKALADMQKIKNGEITGDQRRELNIRIGDFDFVVTTDLSRKTASEGRTLFTQAERKMTYSCPELGIENVPVKQNLLRNAVEDITTNVLTGKDFLEQLEAAQRSKRHNEAELEQMLSREGKPFEYEKELKQAQAQYEEYSELMKKELEEKEAKYADMDASVETANGITSTEEDEEENNGDTLYRSDETNERFNEELERYSNGNMDKNEMFHLGNPRGVMRMFLPDLPIVMRQRVVTKGAEKKHDVEVSALSDMPQQIAHPIFVFKKDTDTIGILTEMKDRNGRNVFVAFDIADTIQVGGNYLEVNNVLTIHGRRIGNIVKPIIENNSLQWVDKKKALKWFSSASPDVQQEITIQELSDAAKVVKDFENPSVKEENSNRNGVGAYTDDEISYENDPWSKLAGRPLRTQFQRKEFARKERQRMVDRVNELAEKLHLDNVDIVTDASTLEGKKKRAKGFYSKSTGKITIVIPNHTSTFDAEQTLLHEAVAHYGLRQLFGEHFDTFLDNVFTNADMQVREQIVALATRNGWDFRKATEEYLATLAENTNFENLNAGWWSKIKQLFMDLLHKIGFDGFGGVALSDNELRYILWRSYQNLVSPGKYKSILGEAEDIAKQYDLKVGDYAETKEFSDKAAEKEDELMFRDIDPDNEFVVKDRAYAAHIYNQRVKGGMYQFKEAMQDSMLGLKELMRSVYEANGKKDFNIADVPSFENAYTGENALSSINEKEVEAFNRTFFQPLNVVISKLATTADERDELIEYMMAKHGLERNVYMAERDAKSKLEKSGKSEEELEKMIEKNRQRDYAGLTALTGIKDVAEAELEAERMVAEYESMHETEPIWDLLKEINDAILSKSLECGLISKETYETISSMYNYYIPLRGFDEKTADEEYAYLNERHGTFNAPIKKANGRRSKADNPLAYLQSMAESTIMQGNRNRFVKNRFLAFVRNHPSDAYSISDLWLQYDDVAGEWKPLLPTLNESDTPEEVERKLAEFNDKLMQLAEEEPEKYKRGREADNIPYRVVNNSDLHQHQVIVKHRGRNVVITINGNPRAAQALNGLTNPDNNDMRGSIGSIISLVGDVNRTLSALFTTLQPDFIVSNFLRDLIYSNSMAFVKEGADYWKRFALNYFVNAWSLKGLFAKYRKGTLDTNNRVEASFKQFLDNGGETGYRRMLDVEEHKKEIEKALKTLNKKMPFEEWRKHFANWLDEIGRSIETKARFAAFMTSRSLGRDIGRSIFDAKEISVNFNKKGAGDRFLKSQGQTLLGKSGAFVSGAGRTLFIFWNAAIQGTFGNFAKALSQHPGRSLSVASALFVLGMFIQKLVSDGDDGDDDKRGSYYDLPETIRRNNFVFPGPGKSWIKVPLPIEYQAIYGMGELLGGKMFHNEPLSVAEFASQISKLTPIDIMEGQTNNKDGLDLLAPFTPSAIKPMLEVQKNRSWYGLPIYKDTPFNKNMPEWTKAYKNTNTKIVDLCAYLNEMSGGTSYEKGKVDLNPAEIEYLLRSYGGGFWTLPNQLVKLYEAGLGEDFDWRNVPLVNRFVTNGDERTKNRALNNEFFRLEEEYKQTMRLIKAYEKDKAQGDKKAVKRLQEIKKSKEYAHLAAFDDKDLYSKIKKRKKMLKEATTEEEEDKLKKELNEMKKQVVKKVRLIDAL